MDDLDRDIQDREKRSPGFAAMVETAYQKRLNDRKEKNKDILMYVLIFSFVVSVFLGLVLVNHCNNKTDINPSSCEESCDLKD